MLFGTLLLAVGVCFWWIRWKYKEPLLRNRLQNALHGNSFVLMGLSGILPKSNLSVDPNVYTWIYWGGITSSLISLAILLYNQSCNKKLKMAAQLAALAQEKASSAPEPLVSATVSTTDAAGTDTLQLRQGAR